MVQTAMHMAAQKAGKKLEDINYLIGGDLINQIVPSWLEKDVQYGFECFL